MKCGQSKGVVIVEWEASPAGDMIADAVVALVMHAQSSAASIRLTSKPCRHSRPSEEEDEPAMKKQREEDRAEGCTEDRLRLIHDTLKKQFELVEAVYEGKTATFEIKTDTSFESGLLDDGFLKCSVRVEFENALGVNAKIEVECKDAKLAANVQECLRNLSAAMAPITAA